MRAVSLVGRMKLCSRCSFRLRASLLWAFRPRHFSMLRPPYMVYKGSFCRTGYIQTVHFVYRVCLAYSAPPSAPSLPAGLLPVDGVSSIAQSIRSYTENFFMCTVPWNLLFLGQLRGMLFLAPNYYAASGRKNITREKNKY